MAPNTEDPPERPPQLVGQQKDYWEALVERWFHVDKDIRGVEALRDFDGSDPPKWYHYRRAERAALVWALKQIAALVEYREQSRAVEVMQ